MTHSAQYISDRDARAIRATLYGLSFTRRNAFIENMKYGGAPGHWIEYGQFIHEQVTQAERRQQEAIIFRSMDVPLLGARVERTVSSATVFDAQWKQRERRWKVAAGAAVGVLLAVVVFHFNPKAMAATLLIVAPIAILTFPRKAAKGQNW